MGQILTKPGQGGLAWAEIADAMFDPANALRSFIDFTEGAASVTLSGTSGTVVAGAHYSGLSTHASTNLGTSTVGTAHGGTVVLTHNGTTVTANDNVAIGSNSRFITQAQGRRIYFEARVTGSAVTSDFAVGITSAPLAASFSSGSIAAAADSILIGRDAGTDSLTGAAANRTLQLCVRGSTGSMTETVLVLPATLSASTVYRIGFFVDGRAIQAYINGIKTGPVVQYDNTSGTPAAMGWHATTNARSTTASPLTIDYIATAATR